MSQKPSISFSSQRVVGISSSFLHSPTVWPRNAEMLSPPSVTCSLVVGVLPWQLGNIGLNLPGRGKPKTCLAFLGQVVLTSELQHKRWEAPPSPFVTVFLKGAKQSWLCLVLWRPAQIKPGTYLSQPYIPAALVWALPLGVFFLDNLLLSIGLWKYFSKVLNAFHFILTWGLNTDLGVHSGHRYCCELSYLEYSLKTPVLSASASDQIFSGGEKGLPFKKVHRAKNKQGKHRTSSSKIPEPLWMTSASSKNSWECSASYPGLDQALRTELKLQ